MKKKHTTYHCHKQSPSKEQLDVCNLPNKASDILKL